MSWPQNDLWDRLEAELFRRLGPERYADWVRNVRPLSLDEEEFVVHFETTYARDKFEGLRASVTAAVRRATNRKIRVRFRVEGDSFARPPGADLQDETRRGGILRALPQTFDTFVEGPGNRTALEATRAFASAEPPPFRTLLIHAPSGLGKTHLLRAVGARLSERPRTSVLLFTGEQFARHFDCALSEGHREAFLKRCRSVHALLLDDLHLLAGREEAQRAFLETVLNLEDRGGRAAFTCERPPHQVEGLLRALKSRLRGDCVVTLGRPDPATSAAFLRTCAPPGTPPSVLDHLATHVRTSYKDQMNCLRRVLELGPPTLPAARAVVRDFLSRWGGGLSYEDIARAAADCFGVAVSEIYAPGRSGAAARARRACFYLSRKLLRQPYARIGEHFGGRDPATVLDSCRRLDRGNGAVETALLRQMEERLSAAALR